MLLRLNKELPKMCKHVSVICKSTYMEVSQGIILLARFAVFKYNSNKILRFLTGGYIDTSGGEFHIPYK